MRRIESLTELEKSNGKLLSLGKLCSLGRSVCWAGKQVQMAVELRGEHRPDVQVTGHQRAEQRKAGERERPED